MWLYSLNNILTAIINQIRRIPFSGFFIRAFSFYVLWQIFYDLLLLPNGKIDDYLSISVLNHTKKFLAILGWEIYSSGKLLYINGYRSVEILSNCNALNIMVIYSGFIISYRGEILNRVKYILIGISIIYVLNVVRIMSFSLATVYFQQYWDLFHEFSPFIFFYPFILWLWYRWTLVSKKEITFLGLS